MDITFRFFYSFSNISIFYTYAYLLKQLLIHVLHKIFTSCVIRMYECVHVKCYTKILKKKSNINISKKKEEKRCLL